MKFYTPQEIADALVFDSEGLFYGRVDHVEFCEQGAVLVVYVEFRTSDIAVDKEALIEALREKGVRLPENPTLEFLVLRTREEGLDIPYRQVDRKIKMVKGEIPISEVAVISREVLEGPKGKEEVAVILLETPREAGYRGLKLTRSPRLAGEESVKDKLVISISRGILGYAGGLVVGPGEVGVRVYKKRGHSGYLNWLAFAAHVRRQGYERLYHKLVEYKDPYKHSRLPLDEVPLVRDLLRAEGAPPELIDTLDNYVVRETEGGVYVDVPWRDVLKIGDAIIVK